MEEKEGTGSGNRNFASLGAAAAAQNTGELMRDDPLGNNGEDGQDEIICRICLCPGVDQADSPLIRPCLCTGTSSFVHLSCLNSWRATSETASNKCSVCHFVYLTERTWVAG